MPFCIKNLKNCSNCIFHVQIVTKSLVFRCWNNFSFFSGVPAYFAFGYAFTFGGGNSFIGLEYFCLIGLPPKQYAHAFFQVRLCYQNYWYVHRYSDNQKPVENKDG